MHCPSLRARLTVGVLAVALIAVAERAEGGPDSGETGSHPWWNRPALVEELALSVDQRDEMNAAWEEFERQKKGWDAKAARRAFNDAVVAGDWDAAQRAIAKLVWPRTADAELKIRVLKLLSAEQRRTLFEEHPAIASSRWGFVARPILARRKGV